MGAALSLLYSAKRREYFAKFETVVVIVCGGSGIDSAIMQAWKEAGLWSEGADG